MIELLNWFWDRGITGFFWMFCCMGFTFWSLYMGFISIAAAAKGIGPKAAVHNVHNHYNGCKTEGIGKDPHA